MSFSKQMWIVTPALVAAGIAAASLDHLARGPATAPGGRGAWRT